MSDTKTLADALLEAQREMKNPAKKHTATVPTKSGGSFAYQYASLDDTVTEAKTVLNAVGITLLQPMVSDQFTVGVSTLLLGYGETLDLGCLVMPTNPDPQKVGAIVTYLRRYALGSLGLVAEDDTDAQGVSSEPRVSRSGNTDGRTYGAAPAGEPEGGWGEYKLTFGKHKDETLRGINLTDRDYLAWLADKMEAKSGPQKDAQHAVVEYRKHLGKAIADADEEQPAVAALADAGLDPRDMAAEDIPF